MFLRLFSGNDCENRPTDTCVYGRSFRLRELNKDDVIYDLLQTP